MSQKTLIMQTNGSDLRSSACGWTAEDSSLVVWGQYIGCTPGFRGSYSYGTPLEAQYTGWKLLAPPMPYEEGGKTYYEWWFVKD